MDEKNLSISDQVMLGMFKAQAGNPMVEDLACPIALASMASCSF
jgi:hypothetical protein